MSAALETREIQTSLVPIEHLNQAWEDILPLLEPAVVISNGRYTPYDVYIAAQQQRMQVWIAFEGTTIVGVEVTAITAYPSKRVLTSLFTGGKDIFSWREKMMELLTRWAKDHNCTAIEGFGREGWVKLLERYGVRKVSVMFEKDI